MVIVWPSVIVDGFSVEDDDDDAVSVIGSRTDCVA